MTPVDPTPLPIAVGQPWPVHAYPLPPGDSFGWHTDPRQPAPNLLLLATDPPDPVVATAVTDTEITLGVAAFGRLVVLMLNVPGVGVYDSPRPFIVEPGADSDPDPEVVVEGTPGNEHLTWNLVLVEAGTVRRIRLFTTGPAFTATLRRMFAEQRAAGPVTYAQADAEIVAWQDATPTPDAAWARAEAVSRAGD